MVQVDKLVYGSGATRDAGFVIYIYSDYFAKTNRKKTRNRLFGFMLI